MWKIKEFKPIENGRETLPDFELKVDELPWLSEDKIDSKISIRSITEAYTTTNVTEDRDFDANTVAVAELADVVWTLIADLKKNWIIN